MQVKILGESSLILNRNLTMNVGEDVKGILSSLVVGVQINTASMEIDLEVPPKARNRFTI